MGKPTFDSRNSKTLVLGFKQETVRIQGREVLDFRLSREGMRLLNP